jgi:large conductance mechanosensitive channel
MRGNLVDLAVAVVVGAAFGALVNSLVKDLITPLIAAIGGNKDFSKLYFTVNKSQFAYGDFINAILSFVIIAAVVYFLVVLPVTKVMAIARRNELASERECPECKSEIPAVATRCKFCSATSPATA